VFFFAKLPEVAEENVRKGSVVQDSTLELGVDQYGNIIGDGPLYKQYNMICGFVAQFCK
jgi:MFS transporter, FHS family, L-fucose permease